MNNVFILDVEIKEVAKKGEKFYLSDGYYSNENDTIFIKSCNENYKLFSRPEQPASKATAHK